MASEAERQILAKVLAEVGKQSSRIRRQKERLSGFMAVKGDLYDGKLMVVGRATNGWKDKGVLPKELTPKAAAEHYSHTVLENSRPVNGRGKCPMSWITDQWGPNPEYNTKRSAFWRVIRRVVEDLQIADVEQHSWPSYLVWSNLYKGAPEEGGNPSDSLCNVQHDGCKDLFRLELKIYKSKRLLLLTGYNWASDFLTSLGPTWGDTPELDYFDRHGTLNIASDQDPIRCVVAQHPQGKREDTWVEHVCLAFRTPNSRLLPPTTSAWPM